MVEEGVWKQIEWLTQRVVVLHRRGDNAASFPSPLPVDRLRKAKSQASQWINPVDHRQND